MRVLGLVRKGAILNLIAYYIIVSSRAKFTLACDLTN